MHILFVWEQGLGYGHLSHMFPIARLAGARGHCLTLSARHLENVWAAGAVPFDRVLPAPNVRSVALGQETRTFSDVIRPSGFADARQLTACTRAWHQMFDLLRPDALVCEHAYNAVFAAYLRGLPVARLGTGFSVPPLGDRSPPLRTWQPHSVEECKAADDGLLSILREVAGVLGGPSVDTVNDLFGHGEEFLVTWPELDHLGVQSDRFYYGPMLGLSATAIPEWPTAGKGSAPRVFMYLGDDHPQQAPVLEALRELGWPTVFHARKKPATVPGPAMSFCPQPVNIQSALEAADILINHGSHGTCADALRHGAAMFLLPNTFERSQVAFRLIQQGLARAPAGNPASTAAMVESLRSLVDFPLPNTKAAQQRYGVYDPEKAAAELMEDMEDYFREAASA